MSRRHFAGLWMLRDISRVPGLRQILIHGSELVVVHPSDRTPRHFLPDLMPLRIDSGAHGGDEFVAGPLRADTEIWTERRQLAGYTTTEILAVALAAILIGHQVFAVFGRRPPWRRSNA